jgi:hypothetical protein
MKFFLTLFLLMLTFSLHASSPITVGEYTLFLNATAVPNDLHHCYDIRMATDSSVASIQYDEHAASPYFVINETTNNPAPYLSVLDEMRYCNWRDHGSPTYFQEPNCTEEGSYTLQNELLIAINNEGTYQLFNPETNTLFSYSDCSIDLSLKEKNSRYLLEVQENLSPLMMFCFKAEKEDPTKKPVSAPTDSKQERRDPGSSDFSSTISYSPNAVSLLEEDKNSSSSNSESSSLLKILSYCPGCKNWHLSPTFSKIPVTKVLFLQNKKTGFWTPVYLENESINNSLFQKTFSQFKDRPDSKKIIKNFQLLVNSYKEKILHHFNPKSEEWEKSSLEVVVNALPSLPYWLSVALQARSIIPESLTYSILNQLFYPDDETGTTSQNSLTFDSSIFNNEKNPLIKASHKNYSSINCQSE